MVVKGTAKVTVGDKNKLVTEGESINIPVGYQHCLENPGKIPMLLIEHSLIYFFMDHNIIDEHIGKITNKNSLESKNKKIIIQTDAEFPQVNWFDNYTFFVAKGAKRPVKFLVNEHKSVDEDITMERKETAEITQSLIKLEYRSTWLSWMKIFQRSGHQVRGFEKLGDT